MPGMDYFRRPFLAGKNITRMSLASVRGSIRRADADGIVAYPHFAGVVATQTLNLKLDGVVKNVTLTSDSINTILADINAVLLTSGTAFDADGTIGIRTVTAGPTGSVEVTGGTAAVFLGLDVTNGRIRAVNGDIPSSPEGRVGNWNGVAFPNKGENFTQESVARGMARIAANNDVLYSDDHRSDAVVSKVSFSTSDGRLLTVSPASTRIFTGFGLLSAASTKEDLSSYFHMVDTATKQVANSRVVAVARGAVGGLPPYANATTWSGGGAIGNVLGVDLVKVLSVAIDDIQNGRVIKSSAADFTDVVIGDFVNITGATNTNQWDNNGYKWIVEEVIDTHNIAVRPMSKAELAMVSVVPSNEQPLLELNGTKNGGEVFGNVIVRTGSFSSQVNIIVDPPIPTGATYELWAASAGSARSNAPSTIRQSLSPVYRDNVSNYNPVENGTISGLVASLVTLNCAVTAGQIRLHGKVFNIPARTFLPGAFTNGTNYLFWDEATGDYAASSLLTTPWGSVLDPSVTTNKGHLIAEIVLSAGAISSVTPVNRLRGENAVSVTIGVGGQFATIEAAALWAQAISANYSEVASAAGTFPHFDFILVSDITLTKTVVFGAMPSLTVRGATSAVKLTKAGFSLVFSGTKVEVRDLLVASTANEASFVRITAATTTDSVVIRNIKQTAGNFLIIVDATGVTTGVTVSDCEFTLSRTVVRGTGTGGRGVDSVRILRSKFTHVANLGVHIVCHASGSATAWNTDLLVIQDCDFLGGWGSAAAGDWDPVIVNETGGHVPSRIVIQNVRMDLGNYPSPSQAPLVRSTGADCLVDNFYMPTGKIPQIVQGGSLTQVLNSSFRINTEGATAVACVAAVVRNCTFAHQDTDANVKGGVCITGTRDVSFNTITGPLYRAITTIGSSNLTIEGNVIQLATGADFADELQTGIYVVGGGSHIRIHNNLIAMSYNPETGVTYCVEFAATAVDDISISGNSFGIGRAGTLVGGAGTHTAVTITGNTGYVYQDNGDANTGIAFDAHNFNRCVIANNNIQMIGSGAAYTGIKLSSNYHCVISGNFIEVSGTPFDGGAFPQDTWVITGNTFMVATLAVGFSTSFGGLTTGNKFESRAGVHHVQNVCGLFRNNEITGNAVLNSSLGNFEFMNNTLTGGIDGITNTPTFVSAKFEGNYATVASLLSIASIGDLVFSGNHLTTTTALATGGGTAVVNGNTGGAFTISLGTGSASTLIFSDNTSSAGVALVAQITKAQSNVTTLDLVLTEGLASGSNGLVSENTIGRDLITHNETMQISNNLISRNFTHGRTAGTASKCFFSFNTLGGNITCNDISGGTTYRTEEMVIHGNYFNATTLAWDTEAQYMYVSNNVVAPTNGFEPIIAGLWTHVTGNTMYATAFSTGSNQNTSIDITSTSSLGRCWMTDNWIYGRVDLRSSGGFDVIWFSNNYVYNLSNNPAVACGSIFSSGSFSNNMLRNDLGSITTDAQAGALAFTGSVNRLKINDNSLIVGPLSGTYTGVKTFAVINAVGGANSEIIISGNVMEKPNNATISTFAVTVDYIKLLNASSVVVNVNIGSSGGTVGAAPERQGGLAYFGGAGTYTLAQ